MNVSANISTFTPFAAHKAAQVICFEPDPVSCAMLQEGIWPLRRFSSVGA